MKKRLHIAIILIAAAMMVFACAISVEADEIKTSEGVEGGYIYFDTSTGAIIGWRSSVTSIDIPSTINGRSVTSIADYAFNGCSSLTRITIPNSVTSIGKSAFCLCESIKSITIPGSVTSIGEEAFVGCESLTSITIPESVTSIGDYAFEGCSSLTSITIPRSVTSIGKQAFSSCGLTSITIPRSVTSIGEQAFLNCDSLTSVIIEKGATSIGEREFDHCSNLINITIPNSVTSIGEGAFQYCSNLINITIPNSITLIGDYAFTACKSLTSITIPGSVTSIGEMTFIGCNNLTSVSIEKGVTSIGEWAFVGCSSLTSITIPGSVTSIGECAFSNCYSLTSVIIEKGVTSIGELAFSGCESLTNVMIPNSATSIAETAFQYCHKLTIYCYSGSYAESYAKRWGINYQIIDDEYTFYNGNVTEDMLFGKYSDYLRNNGYSDIISSISNIEDSIIYEKSSSSITLAAIKSDLKAGGAKNFVNAITGGFLEDLSNAEMEEELALELILELQNDSNVLKSLTDSTKKQTELFNIIKGLPKNWINSHSDSKKAIETIANLTNKTSTQIKGIFDKLKQVYDNKGLSTLLKEGSIALDICDAAGMVIGAELAEEDIVNTLLKSLPNADNPLSRGLKRIKQKQEMRWDTNLVTAFFTDEMVDYLVGYGAKEVTKLLGDALSSATFVIELGFKVIGFAGSKNGGNISDYNKAIALAQIDEQLASAIMAKRQEIRVNYLNNLGKSINKLKDEYRILYSARLQVIDSRVKYSKKIASKSQSDKLAKQYEKYKGYLDYDRYISNCLYNANLAYSYKIVDNKAKIVGVSKNSNKPKLAKSAAQKTTTYIVDIPSEVGGYQVGAIDEGVFSGNRDINLVHIPSTCQSIGDSSFSNCENLESVYIEENVESIGKNAFSGCESLIELAIPYSVLEIGDGVVEGSDNVVIIAPEASKADSYAESNNIDSQLIPKTVISLEIEKTPSKTNYIVGEDVDLTGIVAKATFADGSTKDVSDEIAGEFESNIPGETKIVVYYDEVSTTCDVVIRPGECSYKVEYYDTEGNSIKESSNLTGEFGSYISLTPPKIDGYIIVSNNLSFEVAPNLCINLVYKRSNLKDISSASVFMPNDTIVYDIALIPEFSIMMDGKALIQNVDYVIEFDGADVGMGTVYVYGVGDYEGEIEFNFNIEPQELNDSNILWSNSFVQYTEGPSPKAVFVKSKTNKRLNSSDYVLDYKHDKNSLVVNVTVTGKGNYTGTLTKTFIINSKGLLNVSATTKSNMVKETQNATDNKKSSVIERGLETRFEKVNTSIANNEYIVKVRTYYKMGKKVYYSAWENANTF